MTKENVEEAKLKVQMAIDNLCALWPILQHTGGSVDRGFVMSSLNWGGGFVFIECSVHGGEPMMKFETKYQQLTEQEVAEIFGILMRGQR